MEVQSFCEQTGLSQGAVDLIWPSLERKPDVGRDEAVVLEYSPVFDLNPAPPAGFHGQYARWQGSGPRGSGCPFFTVLR